MATWIWTLISNVLSPVTVTFAGILQVEVAIFYELLEVVADCHGSGHGRNLGHGEEGFYVANGDEGCENALCDPSQRNDRVHTHDPGLGHTHDSCRSLGHNDNPCCICRNHVLFHSRGHSRGHGRGLCHTRGLGCIHGLCHSHGSCHCRELYLAFRGLCPGLLFCVETLILCLCHLAFSFRSLFCVHPLQNSRPALDGGALHLRDTRWQIRRPFVL
mmetsp:Transcript_20270/g.40165  ORF Transcript_20270/g.40165 Transcript_20270/m.40165 type:complete len:216 (-) Transcript_20270:177-824(-)